ncbi:PLDc_N domain-containing protein [Frankia sp. CNm7]|uniref:PLDc_N domain-containing protein n=1 Tax=Frankia nepalensis TaxID=1836974 RepID=A0A937UP99_9ACTN|nr:PLD nuclease N-terminal domain-containing protein [Frankia nepalensis]MBL7496040.1 PLDc_N domain-containing protein [Frankia nepalensis]MBL7511839.1 PLDc_N domain-containing protein [Frankia nepalensis]MBL7517216.1 PLDc_N domain-containing protein [Frankia nepalensis]MBL7630644.1 PLDc_N domain-containing protein [Frankia nepalensis]
MGLLLFLVIIAMTVWGVLDVARTPPEDVRLLPKFFWIPLIVVFTTVGCLLWLLFGRPRSPIGLDRGQSARRQHPAYGGRGEWGAPSFARGPGSTLGRFRRWDQPEGPKGPDDDPEFLRELSERLRRQDPDGPASHA